MHYDKFITTLSKKLNWGAYTALIHSFKATGQTSGRIWFEVVGSLATLDGLVSLC